MKRIVSVFLAIALMIGCISTAFASDIVRAEVSASEIQTGDTFEITYTLPISGVYEDAMSLSVRLTYDHDAFELKNITGLTNAWDFHDTTGYGNWEAKDIAGDDISGKSFVAKFECKDSAEAKTYEIATEFVNEDCFDAAGNEYVLSCSPVVVTATEPTHNFNGEMRDNGDGTHSYKCTDVGCSEYGKPTVHSGEWAGNDTQHWKECACGAKFSISDHVGGTATSTERARCYKCGMEYGDYGEDVDPTYIVISTSEVHVGDIFTITYTLPAGADYEDALALGVQFVYDHDAFELKNITGLSGSWLAFNESGYGSWMSDEVVAGDDISGKSFTAKFECKDSVESKTYDIAVEFVDGDCFNSDYADYEIPSGSVSVTAFAPVHNFSGEMRDNGDGTHSYKCTDDGCSQYGKPTAHSGEWIGNDTQHWKECACGAKFDIGNHVGGTATSTERARCVQCGMEYGDYGEDVEPASIEISTSEVRVGDTFMVAYTLPVGADYEDALALGVQYTYDHTAFELVKVSGLSGSWLSFNTTGYASWLADDAFNGDNISGMKFAAEFLCKDSAAAKNYDIAIEFVDGDCFHDPSVPDYVDYELPGGTVSVTAIVPTHNFSGEMRDNGDGTHSYKCTDVGCSEYGKPTAHDSDGWMGNNAQHWKECACGAKFDVGAHVGGMATSTEKAICSDCGMAYGEPRDIDTVRAKANTTEIQPGGTVIITYALPDGADYEDALALGVQFGYDHTAFELVNVTGLSGSWLTFDTTGYASWLASDAINGDNISGMKFAAEFLCKDSAAAKNYDIAIEFVDGDCFHDPSVPDYVDYELIGESVSVAVMMEACAHDNVETLPAVAADCTTDGKTEGKICKDCRKILAAQQVIPAKGHTEVNNPAVAATCTKAGKTAGVHCSVCGMILVAQQEIPAKGHTEVNDPAVMATCTTAGKTAGVHCSVCKEILVAQQMIPARGHTEATDAAKAPTCTESGLTEGKHCTECGRILIAQQVIPAMGHNFNGQMKDNGDGTHSCKCTNAGCSEYGKTTSHSFNWNGNDAQHWKECACGAKNTYGNHAGGTATFTRKAVCSTCHLEYGKLRDPDVVRVAASTADVQVGETVKITYTFPATAEYQNILGLGVQFTYDHDAFTLKSMTGPSGSWIYSDKTGYGGWSAGNAGGGDNISGKAFAVEFECKDGAAAKDYEIAIAFVVEDCFNSDWEEYALVADAVSVTAHINVEMLPAVAATCTETGLTEGKLCKDCGKIFVAQQVIPAKGHTEVIDPAVAETCVTDGLTEGVHCSECHKVLVPQQVIPARWHPDTEVRNAKAATCTEAGYTGDTYCRICDAKVSSGYAINPIGHNYGAWTSISETQHQRICANDPSHVEVQNHHFVGNKCDGCGYVMVLLGDVNNDGKVNQKDVARLRQYLTDPVAYPMDAPQNADVNKDGKINQKDVARLRQYLTDPDAYPMG